VSRWDIPPDKDLDTLVREWVESLTGQVKANTAALYALHWSAHLRPFFQTPESIGTDRISAYSKQRLTKVKRKTLLKERCSLRAFLEWARESGYLSEVPVIAPLARRAKGTAYEVRRRGRATRLEPDECRAIIAALPRWSQPTNGDRYPVRARFVVMYETALRPATLDALSVPEHYRRGDDCLVVSDDIDKSAFGRELPLTDRAREALESVAPQAGVIFGRHDYRCLLERAAARVLDPDRARTFTAYDLRHARLTQLAAHGDLPGVAYVAGHRDVNTTGIYVHPGLRAAKRVLDEAGEVPTSSGRELVGIPVEAFFTPPVRRRGLEPPRVINPLEPESSTGRSHRGPEDLQLLADAIVGAAAVGREVSAARLREFALAAIASTEQGRLALAVLYGGDHAPRRALELVRLLSEQYEARALQGGES
jgi:integrase